MVSFKAPARGVFTATGNLTIPRHKHAAALLPDGSVLIVGGSDRRDSRGQYDSAEIYDPVAEQFNLTGNMSGGNTFEALMDAVRVCSLGQISQAFFEVGGQYRRTL